MLLNRAPRDRTRHHIRRVRRAAAQSDCIGANATIAPKIAAWRHPQRIHWPRTAPQPRATLTRALTQARVLAPRSARSATRALRRARQLLTGKKVDTLIVLSPCAREGV